MGGSVVPTDVEAAPTVLGQQGGQSALPGAEADTPPAVAATLDETLNHVESGGRPHDWWWTLNNWRKRHAYAVFGGRLSGTMDAFFTSKQWLIFTVTITLFCLYAVDVCDVAAGSVEARTVVSGFMLAVFVVFSFELLLSSVFVDEYLLSFFFWVDLVGTATLILDIQWIADSILKDQSSNALQITRAGRAARIGSQIGRISRVLRVLRLLRALRVLKVLQLRRRSQKGMHLVGPGEGPMRPTVLGELLAESTTRKCVIIILFVLIVATFLQTVPANAADYNRIQLLSYGIMSPQSFIVNAPYPVLLLSYVNALNGATVDYLPYTRTGMRSAMQLRTHVQCAKYVGTALDACGFVNDDNTIWYDVTHVVQLNAGMGIILTTVIIVCLGLSAYFFGRDATTYVITPIETMLKCLRRLIMVGGDGDWESDVASKTRKPPETDVLANYVSRLVIEIDNARWKAEEEARISDTLLNSMVPPRIARQLKELRWWEAGPEQQARTIADSFPHATVLFTDIVGFTVLSSRISAEDAMRHLNNMYTIFDEIVEKHGIYKVETIGDSYMLVGGAPEERIDHAERVAAAALEIRACVPLLREISGEPEINVRIGMHSGAVTAGVVGFKNPRWHLFGDTCNTASRMESTGIPGEIQLSCTTYDLIRERFQCKVRGKIAVKGKGEMVTYLLEREHGGPGQGPDSPLLGSGAWLFPPGLGSPGAAAAEVMDREAFLTSPQFKKAMERYTTARNSFLTEEEELCKLLKTLDDAVAAVATAATTAASNSGAVRGTATGPSAVISSVPAAAGANAAAAAAAAVPVQPAGVGVTPTAASATDPLKTVPSKEEAMAAAGVVVPRLAVGLNAGAFKQLVLVGATPSDLKALALHMHEELAMSRAMTAAVEEEKVAALRRDVLFKLYGRVLEAGPGMSLRNTFTCILDALYKIIECDVIKLYVVDHTRGQLWPANRHSAADANRTLPLEGTLVGSAVTRARAVRVDDVSRAPEFNPGLEELPAGYTSKSVMCIPVFSTCGVPASPHAGTWPDPCAAGPKRPSASGPWPSASHRQHQHVARSHHDQQQQSQLGQHNHQHLQTCPASPPLPGAPTGAPSSSAVAGPGPTDVIAVLVAVNRWTPWDEAGTEEGEQRIVPFGPNDEAALREAAACIGLLLMRRRGEMLLASAAGLAGGLGSGTFSVASLPASVARRRLRSVARRNSVVILNTRDNLWTMKQEELMGQARDVLSSLQRRLAPVSLLRVFSGGVGEEALVFYLVRIAGEQAAGRFFNLAHSVGVLQGIYLTLHKHGDLAAALGPHHLLALVLAASLLNIIRDGESISGMPAAPAIGAGGGGGGAAAVAPRTRLPDAAAAANVTISFGATGAPLGRDAAQEEWPEVKAPALSSAASPQQLRGSSIKNRAGACGAGSSWRAAEAGVIANGVVTSAGSATAATCKYGPAAAAAAGPPPRRSRRWSRGAVRLQAEVLVPLSPPPSPPRQRPRPRSPHANAAAPASSLSASPKLADAASKGGSVPVPFEQPAGGLMDTGTDTCAPVSPGAIATVASTLAAAADADGNGTAEDTAGGTEATALSSPPTSAQPLSSIPLLPLSAPAPTSREDTGGAGGVPSQQSQTTRSRASVSARRSRLAALVDDIFTGETNILAALPPADVSAVKALVVTLLAFRNQPAVVLAMPELQSANSGTTAFSSAVGGSVVTATSGAFEAAAGAVAAVTALTVTASSGGLGVATPDAGRATEGGDVQPTSEAGVKISGSGGGDVRAVVQADAAGQVPLEAGLDGVAVTASEKAEGRVDSQEAASVIETPPLSVASLLQAAGLDPARLSASRTAVCALLLLTWSELLHVKDTSTALWLLQCRATDVRTWASRLAASVTPSRRRRTTLMACPDDVTDDVQNLLLLEVPRMQLEVIPLWQRTVELLPGLQPQLATLQANRAAYIALLQNSDNSNTGASRRLPGHGPGLGLGLGLQMQGSSGGGGAGDGGNDSAATGDAAAAGFGSPLSPGSGGGCDRSSCGGVTTRTTPSSCRSSVHRPGGGMEASGGSIRDPRRFMSVKHRAVAAARTALSVVPSDDSGGDATAAAAAAMAAARDGTHVVLGFDLASYVRASSSRSYAGRSADMGESEINAQGEPAHESRPGLMSTCVGGSLLRSASKVGGVASPSAAAHSAGCSRLASGTVPYNSPAVFLPRAATAVSGQYDTQADGAAAAAALDDRAASGSNHSFVGIGMTPAAAEVRSGAARNPLATRPRSVTLHERTPPSPGGTERNSSSSRRLPTLSSRLNAFFTSFRGSGRLPSRLQLHVSDGSPIASVHSPASPATGAGAGAGGGGSAVLGTQSPRTPPEALSTLDSGGLTRPVSRRVSWLNVTSASGRSSAAATGTAVAVTAAAAAEITAAPGPGPAAGGGSGATSGGLGLGPYPSHNMSYFESYQGSGGTSQLQSPRIISPVTSFKASVGSTSHSGSNSIGSSMAPAPAPPPEASAPFAKSLTFPSSPPVVAIDARPAAAAVPPASGATPTAPDRTTTGRSTTRSGLRAKLMMRLSSVASKLHRLSGGGDHSGGGAHGGAAATSTAVASTLLPYMPSSRRADATGDVRAGSEAPFVLADPRSGLVPASTMTSSRRRSASGAVHQAMPPLTSSLPPPPRRTSAPSGALALAQQHAEYAAAAAAAAAAFAASRSAAAPVATTRGHRGSATTDPVSADQVPHPTSPGMPVPRAVRSAGGTASDTAPMLPFRTGLSYGRGLSPVAEFPGSGRNSSFTATPRTSSTLTGEPPALGVGLGRVSSSELAHVSAVTNRPPSPVLVAGAPSLFGPRLSGGSGVIGGGGSPVTGSLQPSRFAPSAAQAALQASSQQGHLPPPGQPLRYSQPLPPLPPSPPLPAPTVAAATTILHAAAPLQPPAPACLPVSLASAAAARGLAVAAAGTAHGTGGTGTSGMRQASSISDVSVAAASVSGGIGVGGGAGPAVAASLTYRRTEPPVGGNTEGGGSGGNPLSRFTAIAGGGANGTNDDGGPRWHRASSKGVWLGLRLTADALLSGDASRGRTEDVSLPIAPETLLETPKLRMPVMPIGRTADAAGAAAATGGITDVGADGSPLRRMVSSSTASPQASQYPSRIQTPVSSLRRGGPSNSAVGGNGAGPASIPLSHVGSGRSDAGGSGVVSLQAAIDMAEAALAGSSGPIGTGMSATPLGGGHTAGRSGNNNNNASPGGVTVSPSARFEHRTPIASGSSGAAAGGATPTPTPCSVIGRAQSQPHGSSPLPIGSAVATRGTSAAAASGATPFPGAAVLTPEYRTNRSMSPAGDRKREQVQ